MTYMNISVAVFTACFFATAIAVHLPVCYFLMRDWTGTYVEVMRKCPAGTSYCASKVTNSTGIRSLVIQQYEYYCDNEINITRYLNVQPAPSRGCYRFGATTDEFVCFCDQDFCNHHDRIESLFLEMHNFYKNQPAPQNQLPIKATTPSSEPFEISPSTLSFSEEFRKLRSPLLTDQQAWKRGRSRRQASPRRSFEQKVSSQKFILAEGSGIFRKNVVKNG